MANHRRTRGERGIALVMTGLVLLPLMVFAAFGVDLASWYTRISYLQKSADAAALAGTVWMPDLTKATAVAKANLAENGVVDKDEGGTDDIDVEISRGSTATSLRVTLTDNSAERYFSRIFSGDQTLTRSAEAEYNLPIPLGSPLNYFGGDHTRTAPPPVTTYAVAWPPDYHSRVPINAPCNIGTSSSHGLGRWAGSPPTFQSGHSGSTQCRWVPTSIPVAGASSPVPPPDHRVRQPDNGNCRVREDGTGTTLGYWRNGSFQTSWGGGSAPSTACTWRPVATDLSTLPPSYATIPPSNRPCRLGWESGPPAPGGGWWPSSGGFDSSVNDTPLGGSDGNGNRLCRWGPDITSSTFTPPNPIDPSRSPGFWAMIEGPGAVSPNGDAYNTRCYINNNCSSEQNVQYRPPSDPDRGFWYVVKMPSVALGSVDINVFDASYNSSGDVDELAGDRSLGGSSAFQTEFRVFRQDNPLDFTVRMPVGSSTANQTEGSCYWNLGAQTEFRAVWKRLCTLVAPAPGDLYLINVRTTGTSGNGINGYALEAVANNGVGVQPAVYAYANMGMQNNNTCSGSGCTPPPATFYLAEVGPQYAGKTLVVDLWDPGDASGNASIFPKMPSSTLPKPVVDVPAGDCSYTSSPAPSAPQTGSDGGPTGVVRTTEQPSDFPSRCGIRTTISGNRQFNGEWLTIRIAIPPEYTCTLGVNPETTPGSCWWGIEYNFSASANDVTTWRARIEGNPVHLTN